MYYGSGLAAGVYVVENGSHSGYRNITPDEYRSGTHFAYEAVCHWFYQVFERKHGREPTYSEWQEFQRDWRSKRSADECNAIVVCKVCRTHIEESRLAGSVPFSMTVERKEELRRIGLPRCAQTFIVDGPNNENEVKTDE